MAKSFTYTNGRILVNSKSDADALSKEVRKLQRYLEEEHAITAEFLLDDSVVYPCYSVPPGVTWDLIEQALRPNVYLKAINEDVIVLPETKVIPRRYYFSEEEKERMAAKSAQNNLAKQALQKKKAAMMKDFKAQIDALDEEIDEISIKYSAGHEEREYVCQQKLNFASGIKFFVDKETEEIIKTEPLEGTDRQLRIDVFSEPGVSTTDMVPEPPEPLSDDQHQDTNLDNLDAESDSAPDGSPFPI